MAPTDLSNYHHPLTRLFASNDGSLQDHFLSSTQLAQFEEEGFVSGLPVLIEPQVDHLRNELASIMDPAHPGHALFHEFHSNESEDPQKVLFHALGAWRIAPGFHDLLWNPFILAPAAQILGGPVRFWHDQLFCKPPRHGGAVSWHQDYSYWTRTAPMAHLTCWIALDETTEENGCLQYVPGSHHWDLLPITGLGSDMRSIQSVLTPQQRAGFKPRPVPVRLGHCSFHHPLTVHGSMANTSDRPRRGAVINFVRDGVRSLTSEPLLRGVPPIPKGRPLAGQFFPLLSSAEHASAETSTWTG